MTMALTNNFERHQIQSVLNTLDEPPALRRIDRPENGLTSSVFLIETDRQDLVLHTFSPDAATWKPQKERILLDLLRRQGVPVPKILKVDLSRSLLPLAYTLTERVPGITLSRQYAQMTPAQRVSVYRQLGDYLGRIHALSFPAYGDVAEQGSGVTVGPARELTADGDNSIFSGPFKAWPEMHHLIVQRHLRFLRHTEFGDLVKPLETWFGEHQTVIDHPVTPRLLHMDLHSGNILVQNDTVTAILDAEESLIGHHEFDLMRTELAHFRGDDLGIEDAFFGEYTRHIALDDGYEERKPFYEMSRALVWLRCLVTYGGRYSSGAEDERHAVRTRISQLLKSY